MTISPNIARLVGLFEEALDANEAEKLQLDTDDREITAERALEWLYDHNREDLVLKICKHALASVQASAVVKRRDVA